MSFQSFHIFKVLLSSLRSLCIFGGLRGGGVQLSAEDIFWNRTYGTCVSINGKGYHCVDFHKIHHTYASGQGDPQGLGVHQLAHGVSHTFPATLHENALDSDND